MGCPWASPPAEPVYPRPALYNKHFLWRLLKGTRSWLGLLSDVDFRIPVGSVQFIGLNLFLVNEPASVKRLLVEEVEAFPKHPYTLWILEPLIGRAIFSVNGEEWARQRRLLDQAFQVAQLRRVLPQMQGAVEAMVARLDGALAAAGDQPVAVEIDQEMTLVTADVIVRTILSRPLAAAEAAGIFDAFSRYQRRAGQALMLRLLRLPQRRLQAYLGRHARTIRSWIDGAIEERLQAGGDADQGDLLQALIEARDAESGSGFGRQELLDQVCFLFLAGHETSASALGMAAYLLATTPVAQQRMRQELQAVLGDRQGPLTFDDLRQLPYAVAVFNETLRLYPPVSFFIREAQQEGELVDRRCPLRSLVTISPWVVQRQEGQWPQPHGFAPERFLAEGGSTEDRQLARDAWLPFGLGPRKCPGAAFALQEALLVLAELVRRYELLPEPGHAPDLVARLTLRSRNGIPLRLRRWPEGGDPAG
jgi:cytochrome P450